MADRPGAPAAAVDRIGPDRLQRPLVVDVGIDVNDVEAMSAFWQAVTGYEPGFELDGHVYLVDPTGRGPHLYLQRVPEVRTEKNRLHLDIVVPDLPASVERARELGARQVFERRTGYTWFIVLTDPEGNQFCLVDLDTWQESRPPWWQHHHP